MCPYPGKHGCTCLAAHLRPWHQGLALKREPQRQRLEADMLFHWAPQSLPCVCCLFYNQTKKRLPCRASWLCVTKTSSENAITCPTKKYFCSAHLGHAPVGESLTSSAIENLMWLNLTQHFSKFMTVEHPLFFEWLCLWTPHLEGHKVEALILKGFGHYHTLRLTDR